MREKIGVSSAKVSCSNYSNYEDSNCDHQRRKESIEENEISQDVETIKRLVNDLQLIFQKDSHQTQHGNLGRSKQRSRDSNNIHYNNNIVTGSRGLSRSRWEIYYANHVMTELLRYVKVKRNLSLFKCNRDQKHLLKTFQGWAMFTMDNLPQKKQRRSKAKELLKKRQRKILLVICENWLETSVGPFARKLILGKRRKRLEVARESLEKKLGSTIIPYDLLQEEVYKNAFHEMSKRRQLQKLTICFKKLQRDSREAEIRFQIALNHYSKKLLRLTLKNWQRWSFTRNQGLDFPVYNWIEESNIDKQIILKVKRYNQVQVDIFADHRIMKYVFIGWRCLSHRLRRSKQIQIRSTSRAMKQFVTEWKRVSDKNRILHRTALTKWIDYSHWRRASIFIPWRTFVNESKLIRRDHDRLVTVYRRNKHRKQLYQTFRKWSHQAKYGRITALYSRNELMRTIVLQKKHCRQVDRLFDQCIDKTEEMAFSLKQKESIIEKLKSIIEEKDKDLVKSKMAIHIAEQELMRLQSVVDCVTEVHPTVTKHILRIQKEEFGFPEEEKGLQDLMRMKKRMAKKNSEENNNNLRAESSIDIGESNLTDDKKEDASTSRATVQSQEGEMMNMTWNDLDSMLISKMPEDILNMTLEERISHTQKRREEEKEEASKRRKTMNVGIYDAFHLMKKT